MLAAMVLALAGAMLAIPASASEQQETVQVANQPRTYAVHAPHGQPPPGGWPLVLAFHGGGMRGEQMRRLTSLDAVADQRGFIVVYPDGIDKHWNDGRSTIRNPQDDVAFVSTLIAQLQQRYKIDRARIYATGVSNGALFAERLGCDLSRQIAAIAPVAGTMPSDIASSCRPAHPVALLQIGGDADPIMPFRGGAVADFGGRGEGGQVLSIQQTSAARARHNGCAGPGAPEALPPAVPGDATRVVRISFSGCPAAGPVTQIAILGGGHTWPGGPQYARPVIVGVASRQIDASQLIADFFLSLPPKKPGN